MSKSGLFKTGVAKKYWMALTGLFLCLFFYRWCPRCYGDDEQQSATDGQHGTGGDKPVRSDASAG